MDCRRCTACSQSKGLDAFALQKGGRDGRHTVCKGCRAARERNRYRENREAVLERMRTDPSRRTRQRAIDLRRRYGLSVDEWESLAASQGDACAVCREVRPLAIDHDHTSGAIRGMLCSPCNLALGHLDDDPERAEALWRYLKVTP